MIWIFSTMKQRLSNFFFFFFFFWNLQRRTFCFLNFVKWGNIKASILLILLKWIVLDYSNGNESFSDRLFQITSRWIWYSIFFRYLIYSVCFSWDFCQKTYEKTVLFQLQFQKSNSRCSMLLKIKKSNIMILKLRPCGKKVR